MAKVFDVPADIFITKLTEILKNEDISIPDWASFVKTGAHAEKPPQNSEWWHTRCASILRKVYFHGPISISKLRTMYGGSKPVGYGAAHHKDASGAIVRNIIHSLEKLGYVEKVEKKGRILTKHGIKKLDILATEILKEKIAEEPRLSIYR
jgi:small subunit ribosomal protein S19e